MLICMLHFLKNFKNVFSFIFHWRNNVILFYNGIIVIFTNISFVELGYFASFSILNELCKDSLPVGTL